MCEKREAKAVHRNVLVETPRAGRSLTHDEKHHALGSEPRRTTASFARCAEHADGRGLRGGVEIQEAHFRNVQLEGGKRAPGK